MPSNKLCTASPIRFIGAKWYAWLCPSPWLWPLCSLHWLWCQCMNRSMMKNTKNPMIMLSATPSVYPFEIYSGMKWINTLPKSAPTEILRSIISICFGIFLWNKNGMNAIKAINETMTTLPNIAKYVFIYLN